jgi:hypothetical protein
MQGSELSLDPDGRVPEVARLGSLVMIGRIKLQRACQ